MSFEKRKVIQGAITLTQQGQYNEAIAEYEAILHADPSDASVYNTLSDLYAHVGLTQKAVACCQKLLDVLKADGRRNLAIAVCKKIIKLDPKSAPALEACADLYAEEGLRAEAKQHYLLAVERFLKSGSEKRALEVSERLIRLEPGDTAMAAHLASLIAKDGRGPAVAELLSRLAQEARTQGRLDSARALYQQMVAITPQSFTGWYWLGRTDFDMGRFEDAEEALRRAANIDVDSLSPPLLLAQLYEKQGKPEQAKAAWVALLRCDPNHQEAHQRLGQLYLIEGDAESAVKEFDAVARSLCESGELVQAIALLDQLGPVADHPLIQERRGDVLARSGRLMEAKAAFQRAAELHLANGRFEECQQMLSRLIGLGPGASEGVTWLHEGAGTKSGAVNLESTDDLSPFSSTVKRVTPATSVPDSSPQAGVSEEVFRLPDELGGNGSSILRALDKAAEEPLADLPSLDFSMNQAIEAESSDPLRCFIAGNSGDGKSVHGRVSLDPKPLTKDGESDSEIEVVSADTFDKSEALTVSNEPSGEQDAGSPADSSPEACEAYYQLGVTYREMGMLDGAIAEFRRSSLDARLALRARTMVGLCLLAKGDAEAAIDELSRALSILGRPSKEYQAAKYDLATAYQAIGILNAALAILRSLQKESPALRDMEHRVLKLKGHLTQIAGFSETPNRSSDPIDRPEAVGT